MFFWNVVVVFSFFMFNFFILDCCFLCSLNVGFCVFKLFIGLGIRLLYVLFILSVLLLFFFWEVWCEGKVIGSFFIFELDVLVNFCISFLKFDVFICMNVVVDVNFWFLFLFIKFRDLSVDVGFWGIFVVFFEVGDDIGVL